MSETNKTTVSSGGIGLSGMLTLLFVTLKLIGAHFETPVYHWSWWWVLSPLWISLFLLFALAMAIIVEFSK